MSDNCRSSLTHAVRTYFRTWLNSFGPSKFRTICEVNVELDHVHVELDEEIVEIDQMSYVEQLPFEFN